MDRDDRDFLQAFEACTLPPEQFRHRAHVRLAWLLLREEPTLVALDRFCRGLRRFAASLGQAGIYHETITCAYFFLIQEAMERTGRDLPWAEFIAQNRVLLESPGPFGAVGLRYREETLRSELARRVFVLPDRAVETA